MQGHYSPLPDLLAGEFSVLPLNSPSLDPHIVSMDDLWVLLSRAATETLAVCKHMVVPQKRSRKTILTETKCTRCLNVAPGSLGDFLSRCCMFLRDANRSHVEVYVVESESDGEWLTESESDDEEAIGIAE